MIETSLKEEQVAPPAAPVKKKERIFFPNLDGLRFFCFMSVFLFHSFATDYQDVRTNGLYAFVKYTLASNGFLGVNFFFVLSGFLITYLLVVEKEHFGKIDIKSFYIRRALRIWPLFYFCVFFGFVVFPLLKTMFGGVPNETANWEYYVTFLNSFDMVKVGMPDASTLSVLWSVAIEEQFYLVWPLLLGFLPTRFYLPVFGLIITGSFIFRMFNVHNELVFGNHTFSCISDMTVGGVAAVLIYYVPSFKNKIINASRVWVIALYAAVFIVYFFHRQIFYHGSFLSAADRLVISILFALVILEQSFTKRSLFKMSKYKYVSKLGTYTYGLYCLHMIGILFAAIGLKKLGLNRNVYQIIFLEGSISFIVTLALAYLSYTFFESKFLKLKERFARITKN